MAGMSEPDPVLIGGHYRLLNRLQSGRGGFGEVWRARDEFLHVDVALKRIDPPARDADRAEWAERVRREARNAARLRSQPNIVPVFDVVTDDAGIPWIIMRLLEESLADKVTRAPLTPDEAADVTRALLRALKAAHAERILHRDIKPANVLLAGDEVQLGDFGIARSLDEERLTESGNLIGTLEYMAPERLDGDEENPVSDLFSLGATMYQAVTGASPFRRPTPQATVSAVCSFEPESPDQAGPIAPVIMAMLRKDPGERPTAQQALDQLEENAARLIPIADGWYTPTRTVKSSAVKPPAAKPPAAKPATAKPPAGDEESGTGVIRVSRPHAKPLESRSFTVLIDGEPARELPDRTSRLIKVTPRSHEVQVTAGEYQSKKIWVDAATGSPVLIVKPAGGEGSPITGLDLKLADSGSGTSSSWLGWAAAAAVALGLLLYHVNGGFASWVTDTWHLGTGSPWTAGNTGCVHHDTKASGTAREWVTVWCWSAAATYRLDATSYSTLGNQVGSVPCSYVGTWSATTGVDVKGPDYGKNLDLCLMPR
jgi:serine/threonine protein kinase